MGKLKQQPVLPTCQAVTHGLARLCGGWLVATTGTVNATLTARERSVYPGGVYELVISVLESVLALGE